MLMKISLTLIRTVCLLLGILILMTVAPHKNPWQMSNVQTKLIDQTTVIKLQIIPFHWTVQLSLNMLIVFIVLFITALIIVSRNTRDALMEFVQRRKLFLIVMVVFLWLFWTRILWAFILLVAGLILIGLFALIKKNKYFLRDSQIFLFRLFIFSVFLFTLKPTQRGLPVILYLTFGSFGILLILIGGYPILVSLGKRYSKVKEEIFIIAQSLYWFFMNSKKSLFITLIFLSGLILTNLGTYLFFERIPHVTDSVVQVFHGKIFATGQLVAPCPPLKEFFDFNPLMIMREGKWYSVYPPGHSFLMMFGVLVGIPWLINPLLGTFTVILFYLLGKEIYDEKTGRIAALLGLLSPFLIIMSSGFMNHTSSLFYGTLFMLFFAKTLKNNKIRYSIISGLGLGIMINIRPYTALAIAVPFFVYSVWLLFRAIRVYLLRLTIIAVVTLCLIGVLLGYNYATNGSPTLFGYVVQFGKEHNPGFHNVKDRYYHIPEKGWKESRNRLNFLNVRLFEWPIPSLLFILILFISGKTDKWDYLLIGVFFSLLFAHFFYWYSVGNNLIPRFLYESISALILLTARGILRFPYIIRKNLKIPTTRQSVNTVIAFVLILCLIVILCYYIPSTLSYYQHDFYKHIQKDILKAVKEREIKNAVIFVKSSLYRGVFPANSPLLNGEVIYAIDRGEKNKLLMEYYPTREYYRADGESITKILKSSDF